MCKDQACKESDLSFIDLPDMLEVFLELVCHPTQLFFGDVLMI